MAIKARVQELEMEEEIEKLKDDDRYDMEDMQLQTNSPRPGEAVQGFSTPNGLFVCASQY